MAELNYLKSLNEVDKCHYLSKLQLEDGRVLPDPFQELVNGWSEDISKLPSLSWRDVSNYLIDTPSPYTKESLKAYKSLDAFGYFMCGHVQDCYIHDITDDVEFCFVKSKVSYLLVPSRPIIQDS